jgi:sigma-B regulation protein RsbU (phosphoserine phosphatase)
MLQTHNGFMSATPDTADVLSRSLREAQQVQQHLLPRELPRPDGWDLAAAYRPARVVSGDYYDVFDAGPGRLALALGDVSGKGLGPALVMAGLRAALRVRLHGGAGDLAGVLRDLNAYLLDSTPDDMFVSLIVGVLDVDNGRFRYGNAGHPPPLVLHGTADGEPIRLAGDGPVLGVVADAAFQEAQVILRPGSLLALFSDGLTEATDAAGRMFRDWRLCEALRAGCHGSAGRVLAGVLDAVEQFRGQAAVADDISVLLLRRSAARVAPLYGEELQDR